MVGGGLKVPLEMEEAPPHFFHCVDYFYYLNTVYTVAYMPITYIATCLVR